jgi:hypothetical protein
MTEYNLQWIRDFAAKRLDYDSTEPDQAYGGTTADPWMRLDTVVNDAYTEIINEAKNEVDQSNFLARYAFTWPADSLTYQLPRHIAYSKSEKLMNVTNHVIGDEARVFKSYRSGGLFWKDSRTLHWSTTTGPSEDKSFEWVYLADAEELQDAAQVPILIPYRWRFLLAWKATVLARVEIDEDDAPRSWYSRVERMMGDYIVDLGQGRLRFSVPPQQGGVLHDTNLGVRL